MRKIQKVIITIYGILVATACIYVPWKADSLQYNAVPLSLQYSPFWWNPILKTKIKVPTGHTAIVPGEGKVWVYETVSYTFNRTIDYKQIILVIIAITAIFAVLFILTLRPKQKEEQV